MAALAFEAGQLVAELEAHGVFNADDLVARAGTIATRRTLDRLEANRGQIRNPRSWLAKVLRNGGTGVEPEGGTGVEQEAAAAHSWAHDLTRWAAICAELPDYGDGRIVKAGRLFEAEGRPVSTLTVKAALDRGIPGDVNPPGPLLTAANDTAVVIPRELEATRHRVLTRQARLDAAQELEADGGAPPTRAQIKARAAELAADRERIREADELEARRERNEHDQQLVAAGSLKRLDDGERRGLPMPYRFEGGWRVSVPCQDCGVRVHLGSPERPNALALKVAASSVSCDECIAEVEAVPA